ncbi:HDOD domain-containing protein [Chromatium okenii]|uniref:Histidine kinase n=1 Tax=Chromatium okenii TaxID=61644 RepID=A0A2S7XQT2_9GAMM|nr:HDOD domain-containing protein [Chromatium okenii]PQJ96016.1 histidine kinase [Chromatium okenii]
MIKQYPSKPELETAFKTIRQAQVPQIPDVVLALRAELARTEPNVKAVANLIAQDLALTGQILKRVNSPLFALSNKITGVQQAVALIGINRLVNLVTAEAVERLLEHPPGAARVIWESIMEQAQVAVTIAQKVTNLNLEEVYLFGIMHDVGSLIFAEQLDNYGYEWVLRSGSPQSLLAHEQAALGVDHTTVGFLLASIWQLPDHLTLAIYHHHAANYQQLEDSRVRALVAITQLTHALMALPFGTHDQPEMLTYRDRGRLELDISEEDWAGLCKHAMEGSWPG